MNYKAHGWVVACLISAIIIIASISAALMLGVDELLFLPTTWLLLLWKYKGPPDLFQNALVVISSFVLLIFCLHGIWKLHWWYKLIPIGVLLIAYFFNLMMISLILMGMNA